MRGPEAYGMARHLHPYIRCVICQLGAPCRVLAKTIRLQPADYGYLAATCIGVWLTVPLCVLSSIVQCSHMAGIKSYSFMCYTAMWETKR